MTLMTRTMPCAHTQAQHGVWCMAILSHKLRPMYIKLPGVRAPRWSSLCGHNRPSTVPPRYSSPNRKASLMLFERYRGGQQQKLKQEPGNQQHLYRPPSWARVICILQLDVWRSACTPWAGTPFSVAWWKMWDSWGSIHRQRTVLSASLTRRGSSGTLLALAAFPPAHTIYSVFCENRCA